MGASAVSKRGPFISDSETGRLGMRSLYIVVPPSRFTFRNPADRPGPCWLPEAVGQKIWAVIRKAFRMAVDPGGESEYERRHRPVWPELEKTLVEHGVRSYSIFLDPATNDLFGYAEVECEAQWNAIASTDVCKRWWRHMRDLMPTNPDSSPVSRDLREVFHIGTGAV
jgi:L-rhamnose mutarotase